MTTTNPQWSVVFTGSQSPRPSEQMEAVRLRLGRIIREHPGEQVVVRHGQCIGADAQMHEICLSLGVSVILHPGHIPEKTALVRGGPAVTALPPEDTMVRNERMVALSDEMIAAPKGIEIRRSGTWATARRARRRGMPIHTVWPNGRIDFQP